MTALMTRPTTQIHRPNRRRRVAFLAGLLALAAGAVIVLALQPGPVQVPPSPLPPLQQAQADCKAGYLAGGALVLTVAADANDPAAACVLHRLGIPADRYAMVQTALHDAVPDFGNATNTISWGRFYAKISPADGRARVEIVLL